MTGSWAKLFYDTRRVPEGSAVSDHARCAVLSAVLLKTCKFDGM